MDDFNPYAAPEVGVSGLGKDSWAEEGRGVWRDGDVLVMAKVARLPSRCVTCNEPATCRLKRALSWHSPWLYLMVVFPGLLFYVIVALIVRKTAKVDVPLCEEHRARRSKGILLAWVVSLAGIGLFFAPAFIRPALAGYPILLGAIMLLGGLIFGSLRSQVVTPAKIDDTHAWLKKVGPAYLAELPLLPGSGEPRAAAKPAPKIAYDEL